MLGDIIALQIQFMVERSVKKGNGYRMAYDAEYKDIILYVFCAILVVISLAFLFVRIAVEALFRRSTRVKTRRVLYVAQYVTSIGCCFFFGSTIVFFFVPVTWGSWYIGLWIHLLYWLTCFFVINRHGDWPSHSTIQPTEPEEKDIELPASKEQTSADNAGTIKPSPKTNVVKEFFHDILKGFLEKKIFTIISIVIIILATVFYNLSLTGCCFTFYPIFVSTSMSRIVFQQGKICQWNTVCYSYLTVTEDISTSMIVNFQFQGPTPSRGFVSATQNNGTTWMTYPATCYRLTLIIEETRYQCWSDIIGLTPNTTYNYFSAVTIDNANVTGTLLKFRTGPSNTSDDSFSFIDGGDIMASESGIALLKHAATLEPLFFIIGGDIAYENGDANCYRRWDMFFDDWNKYLVTPTGYSVPILTCIGNHEASGFGVPRFYDSYYIRLFPHQTGLSGMDPQSRDLFHSHRVGSQTV
jgi:hypothetical protein